MRGSYLNISTPNPPQENELQSLPWGQGRPQLSPAGRRLVGEEEGREPGTSRSPPRPPQHAPPPPRRCYRAGAAGAWGGIPISATHMGAPGSGGLRVGGSSRKVCFPIYLPLLPGTLSQTPWPGATVACVVRSQTAPGSLGHPRTPPWAPVDKALSPRGCTLDLYP